MDWKLTRKLPALLAGVIASGVGLCPGHAHARGERTGVETRGGRPPTPKSKAKKQAVADRYARRGLFYQRNWGVDIVGVRRVASGYMLRFDYRVVDPDKASVLTDRKARPYLIDEATRTALAVPAMENIGELRQVAPLELNRTYFMIFGNPGGVVKTGNRVTVVVGNFRAEGLVVKP